MTDKKTSVTVDTTVNSTELAAVLGLSVRRIQQMAQDGTLPTISRGKFLLADSVQKYIAFINKDIVSEEERENELLKSKSEAILKDSKARIAKMEADELSGKLHRSEDVCSMTTDLIYSIRGMLMSLPSRVALNFSTATTPAEASDIVRKEVYEIMRELSSYKYDSKKYEERVRTRRDWDALVGDENGS